MGLFAWLAAHGDHRRRRVIGLDQKNGAAVFGLACDECLTVFVYDEYVEPVAAGE